MSSLTLPPAPAGATPLLIEPANQAAAHGGAPVVPGMQARRLYLPQVGLVLVLCLIGLLINLDSWRAVTALRAAGAPATARVVDIDSWRLSSYRRLYVITFTYEVAGPDGAPRAYRSSDLTLGDRREHGRFFLGQELPVRYLPADPSVARFRDSAPPSGWLALFVALTTLALCVLLYFAKWAWDDLALQRRGQICAGTVLDVRPSLWPRTQQVRYRFTAPDGRELTGHADVDARRLRHTGDPLPGMPALVLYGHDGLHTML